MQRASFVSMVSRNLVGVVTPHCRRSAGAGAVVPSTLAQYAWQQGSSLPQPSGDGALFVLGGKLFQAGGWAGDADHPLATTYVTDLNDQVPGNWRAAGIIPGGGRFGAGSASQDSRAYLLGGNDGVNTLARVDSFDGSTWRAERPLPLALHFPGVAIAGNRLHVAGGLPGPRRPPGRPSSAVLAAYRLGSRSRSTHGTCHQAGRLEQLPLCRGRQR